MIDDQTPHRPLPKPSELLTLREKAGAMAEVVLETAYEAAVNDETSIKIKMEFIDLCAKLGDLMPKTGTATNPRPGIRDKHCFRWPGRGKSREYHRAHPRTSRTFARKTPVLYVPGAVRVDESRPKLPGNPPKWLKF